MPNNDSQNASDWKTAREILNLHKKDLENMFKEKAKEDNSTINYQDIHDILDKLSVKSGYDFGDSKAWIIPTNIVISKLYNLEKVNMEEFIEILTLWLLKRKKPDNRTVKLRKGIPKQIVKKIHDPTEHDSNTKKSKEDNISDSEDSFTDSENENNPKRGHRKKGYNKNKVKDDNKVKMNSEPEDKENEKEKEKKKEETKTETNHEIKQIKTISVDTKPQIVEKKPIVQDDIGKKIKSSNQTEVNQMNNQTGTTRKSEINEVNNQLLIKQRNEINNQTSQKKNDEYRESAADKRPIVVENKNNLYIPQQEKIIKPKIANKSEEKNLKSIIITPKISNENNEGKNLSENTSFPNENTIMPLNQNTPKKQGKILNEKKSNNKEASKSNLPIIIPTPNDSSAKQNKNKNVRKPQDISAKLINLENSNLQQVTPLISDPTPNDQLNTHSKRNDFFISKNALESQEKDQKDTIVSETDIVTSKLSNIFPIKTKAKNEKLKKISLEDQEKNTLGDPPQLKTLESKDSRKSLVKMLKINNTDLGKNISTGEKPEVDLNLAKSDDQRYAAQNINPTYEQPTDRINQIKKNSSQKNLEEIKFNPENLGKNVETLNKNRKSILTTNNLAKMNLDTSQLRINVNNKQGESLNQKINTSMLKNQDLDDENDINASPKGGAPNIQLFKRLLQDKAKDIKQVFESKLAFQANRIPIKNLYSFYEGIFALGNLKLFESSEAAKSIFDDKEEFEQKLAHKIESYFKGKSENDYSSYNHNHITLEDSINIMQYWFKNDTQLNLREIKNNDNDIFIPKSISRSVELNTLANKTFDLNTYMEKKANLKDKIQDYKKLLRSSKSEADANILIAAIKSLEDDIKELDKKIVIGSKISLNILNKYRKKIKALSDIFYRYVRLDISNGKKPNNNTINDSKESLLRINLGKFVGICKEYGIINEEKLDIYKVVEIFKKYLAKSTCLTFQDFVNAMDMIAMIYNSNSNENNDSDIRTQFYEDFGFFVEKKFQDIKGFEKIYKSLPIEKLNIVYEDKPKSTRVLTPIHEEIKNDNKEIEGNHYSDKIFSKNLQYIIRTCEKSEYKILRSILNNMTNSELDEFNNLLGNSKDFKEKLKNLLNKNGKKMTLEDIKNLIEDYSPNRSLNLNDFERERSLHEFDINSNNKQYKNSLSNSIISLDGLSQRLPTIRVERDYNKLPLKELSTKNTIYSTEKTEKFPTNQMSKILRQDNNYSYHNQTINSNINYGYIRSLNMNNKIKIHEQSPVIIMKYLEEKNSILRSSSVPNSSRQNVDIYHHMHLYFFRISIYLTSSLALF